MTLNVITILLTLYIQRSCSIDTSKASTNR